MASWWHSQKNAENFAKNMKKIELCKKISLSNFMNDIVVQKFGCANACTCEKLYIKGNQTLRSQIEVKNWKQQHAV